MREGLGWRRFVAHRDVLAVVLATVLLATTLLVATSLYASSVTRSTLRAALTGAPLEERTLQLSESVDESSIEEREQQVRAALERAFASTGVDVYASAVSASYGFRRGADRERDDLTVFASYNDLAAHARLARGRWPETSASVVEVAVPVPAARRLGLRPGDTVALENRLTGSRVTAKVAGTFVADRTTAAYWLGERLALDGVEAASFTTYGPLVVPRSVFVDRFAAGASVRWRVAPRLAGATAADVPVLQAGIRALDDPTEIGGLGTGVVIESGLDELLQSLYGPLLVLRSTITVPTALLVVLGLATLLLSIRLLNTHRAGEVELLRARGMSSGQLVLATLREALVLIAPAALAAPLLAQLMLRVVDGLGPLGNDSTAATGWPGVRSWGVAALVALACFVVLALHAWGSGHNLLAERQARDRPARSSQLQRAGGDLLLALLAGLAYWQLVEYGSPVVSDASGRLGVDPLLVLAPTLLLLAGAVLALRLFPLLARVADRLAGRTRGALAALGTWQLSRRAPSHTGSVLLLVLAVAAGTFSLTFADAWARSSQDQADFRGGADVRLTSVPGDVTAREVQQLTGAAAVTPVFRHRSPFGNTDAEVLGVDATTADEVLNLRPDLTGRPLTELTDALADARPDNPVLEIPAIADALILPVRLLSRPSTRSTTDVFAVVRDEVGLLHRLTAGPLLAGEDGDLTVDVGSVSGVTALIAVEIRTQSVARDVLDVRLGPPRATAVGGRDLGRLRLPAGSRWQLAFESDTEIRARGDLVPVRNGGVGATIDAGCCDPITFALLLTDDTRQRDPLPALVSADLDATLGGTDRFLVDPGTAEVELRVEGVLAGVPTVDPAELAGVVVDLPSLSDAIYRQSREVLAVDEWWLTARHGSSAGAVAAALDSPRLTGATVVDPDAGASGGTASLAAGVAGAISIGTFGAAVFAALGFALGSVVSLRGRRAELAVLRAVGVGQRRATRLLVAEQVVLVTFGVGVGVGVGAVLARFVVPLVTLTPTATAPFPEVLVVLPWHAIGLFTAAVLLIVAVLVVTAVVSRRDDDLATGRALREGA